MPEVASALRGENRGRHGAQALSAAFHGHASWLENRPKEGSSGAARLGASSSRGRRCHRKRRSRAYGGAQACCCECARAAVQHTSEGRSSGEPCRRRQSAPGTHGAGCVEQRRWRRHARSGAFVVCGGSNSSSSSCTVTPTYATSTTAATATAATTTSSAAS